MATKTLKPTKKGQHSITFHEGALTREAKSRHMSISQLCANPPTGKISRQCSFKKNVLTGPKGR